MKKLRKSLVRSLVAGSLVVGGSAFATPSDPLAGDEATAPSELKSGSAQGIDAAAVRSTQTRSAEKSSEHASSAAAQASPVSGALLSIKPTASIASNDRDQKVEAQEGGDGARRSIATRTGNGLTSSWRDEQITHQRQFHGNPNGLEQMHFTANQALHVGGGEESGEGRDAAKSEGMGTHVGTAFGAQTGFAAALNRVERFEAGMSMERASARGSNEAVSDKASDEMGDIAPSGNDTGDKASSAAKAAANNRFIANDFHSAVAQMQSVAKAALPGQEGQLHLGATQAQQLTQSDESENSTRNMASAMKLNLPKEPMLGTHNNFMDATEKVHYADPGERMAHVHTPAKFFH